MRTKAQGKFNKTEPPMVLPSVIPAPSKSKEFAYTNIRLSASVTGGVPSPPPNMTVLLESLATATAAPTASTTPFITQTVVPAAQAAATSPFVTTPGAATAAQATATSTETSELQAKLAELQAQIEQLKGLKKGTPPPPPAVATPGRRLKADTGLPGWDAGALLEKVQGKCDNT